MYSDGIYKIIDFSHSINFYELGKTENIRLPGGTYAFSSPLTKTYLHIHQKNINQENYETLKKNS